MTWNLSAALRARREQLNLTQSDVALALGITNSLYSLLESGRRSLTGDQVAALATILRLPTDLLLLGSGKMPPDLRVAMESNAPEVAAAIRQRFEADAIRYPTIPGSVPFAGREMKRRTTVVPERVNAQKTSTSYRAHSYHTKVPPEAITPFIRSFTRPGETVFDPFCGSGMTGVAALLEGRNALLSDLSPAAVHIARNYTAPCNPSEFAFALERVRAATQTTVDWLYRPLQQDGIVEYTTWSDEFRCPACAASILYWDCLQATGDLDSDRIPCPSCGASFRKAELVWCGERPVQSHTSTVGSRRIHAHAPTRQELALIEDAEAAPIPYWTPQVPFGPEREMWRGGHRDMGIDSVGGFFTRRNLHALAALRHAIVCETTGRVREALMFAFTACVNRASKRYQWNAKRPTNVMTGTLYVSSLRYEWNVWSLFNRKAQDVLRYYRSFPTTSSTVDVFQRSAADLDCVPDRSIDMIFMDPPFGSNIFYADASLLWDSWLGQTTDQRSEMVVNKSRKSAAGGKSLSQYGELMQQAFAHGARVLKPGGRAVLAFSNSDDKVWTTVQNALRDAGFESESVHMLNKGQPSIKGVKGVTGKETVTTFDLLICLKHSHRPALVRASSKSATASSAFVENQIMECLTGTAGGCRTDEVYSAVIRAALDAHLSLAGITMPSVENACRSVGATEAEGRWRLSPTSQNRDFVAGYISDSSDLPIGTGSVPPTNAPAARSVAGGRASPLYQAHSYHTKVPPESITPFIEHFSKPGDVVLDPFCGSGMTGVAALQSGRRVILNDLSPAAVHLAWNHTHACEPSALQDGFTAIYDKLRATFRSMYATRLPGGKLGYVHWTLWSTQHRCPACKKIFFLWDTVDQESGRIGNAIECPKCGVEIKRARLESILSAPVWIAYETSDGKRFEKSAVKSDVQLAQSFSRQSTASWFPHIEVSADREMYIRCALARQGIAEVADFYTARNLVALSLIWDEINMEPNVRVRNALAFAFTNTAWHGTRMRRFNARGGQRPLTGTLFVPQLSSEANVLEVMKNKIKQLKRYYEAFDPKTGSTVHIQLGSATRLSQIPDGSIDYVFTDPPFGSNLFYADCNLIWEAWLGRLTRREDEAVVNRSLRAENGGKSLADYAELMEGSMSEISRVLKPGGWATVVFHNTDAEVWKAIRDSASRCGFEFHEASSLGRKQQSHKGYKGKSGAEDVAHFDVIFNLRKPAASAQSGKAPRKRKAMTGDQIALLVRNVAKSSSSTGGVQEVHAEVMRRLASSGAERFVDYGEVRRICESVALELAGVKKRTTKRKSAG